MIAVTAIASIVTFLIAFWFVRVAQASIRAIAIARQAVSSMRDPALDDTAREATARSAAMALLRSLGSILIRALIALGASLLPIWLAATTGLAASEDVSDFLLRWDVMLITCIVLILGYVGWTRWGMRS